MAKQTFTSGQVLTAAQMTSLQQTAMGGGSPVTKTASYVLAAADAGTVIQMNNAGATTITVNTGLFSAGDTVFLQNIGAGTSTITAGTATVTTAGSLALTQWEGGTLYFTSSSAAIFFDFIQAGTTLPLTTKGDLFGFDTTNARIPIGTNGQVLTADSTQALGLKWASSASSGASWSLINSGGTALTGAQTVTVSSISGYNQLAVFIGKASSASNSSSIGIRFNGDTSSATYGWFGFHNNISATYASTDYGFGYDGGSNGYWWLGLSPNAAKDVSGGLIISGTNTSAIKMVDSIGAGSSTSGTSQQVWLKGTVNITAAITSVSCYSSVGNFDGGTMYIYGSAV